MSQASFDQELQDLMNEDDRHLGENFQEIDLDLILNDYKIDHKNEYKSMKNIMNADSQQNENQQQEPSGEIDDFLSEMGEENMDKLWDHVDNQVPNIGVSTHEIKLEKPKQELLSTLQQLTLPTLQSYGTPVALAIGPTQIVLGLVDAQVLVLEIGSWRVLHELTVHEILDVQKVTCLDISGNIVVSGYSNGLLAVWDATNGTRLKSIGGVHMSSIVSLRVLASLNQGTTKVNFVSGDYSGNIFWMTVKHVLLWGYAYDRQRLLPKLNQPCLEIQTLNGRRAIEKQYTLVTVSSYDTVYTLCLYPVTKILHQFQRPSFIPNKIQPQIDWGFTSFQGQTTIQPVLSIAWGHLIQIISFNILQSVAQITPKQENYLFHYLQQSQISFCKFIQDGTLAVYDGEFKILYIPYFQLGHYPVIKKYDLDHAQYASCFTCIQQTLTYKKEIDAQQFENDKELITNNTMRSNSENNQMYLLQSGAVEQFQLLSWTQYLNKMIEQIDSQDYHSWFQLLNMVIQVYKGEVRGMTQTSTKQDRILIDSISEKLIKMFIEEQSQSTLSQDEMKLHWQQTLTLTIQYCLECNQKEFLFKELKTIIAKHIDISDFYNALEPFIKLITNVDKRTFVEIATYLHANHKNQILQEFLISLNLSSIDIGYTYELCHQEGMFIPLVYLCPRLNNDFITPLNKMLYKWIQADQLNDKTLLVECLWFIEITWKEQLYPNERLTQTSWVLALNQQVVWLLCEDNLKIFLQHTYQELFRIILMLYQEPSLSVLEQDHPTIHHYFKYDSKNKARTHDGNQNIHKLILSSINQTFQSQPNITPHQKEIFYNFVGNLHCEQQTQPNMKQNHVANLKCIGMDLDILVEALVYYIHSNDHDHYNFKLYLLHSAQYEYGSLQNLIENPQLNNEVDIQAYQLFIDQDFSGCLKLLQQTQLKIFQFIQFALLNHSEFNEPFILSVQNIFEDLIELSPKESFSISKTIGLNYWEQNHDFCKLRCDPKNLLEFFQLAMTERPDWMPKLQSSLMYIDLLSTYHPKLVYEELKTYTYPLEEVETILLSKQHSEGLAYIKEQFGMYDQCLTLYFEVFQLEAQQAVKSSSEGQISNTTHLQNHFSQIMNACKKSQDSQDENKVLYLHFAKKLFNSKMLQSHWNFLNLTNRNNSNSIRHLTTHLNKLFSQLFIMISKEISIAPLIQLIEGNAELFNMGAFRSSFTQVLEDICWEHTLLRKTKTIVIQDNINMNEVMMVDSSSSPGYENQCLECARPEYDLFKETEKNDNVILLRCGHTVHQVCIRNKFCSLCQNKTVEAMFQSLFEEERKQQSKLKEYTYTYLQPQQDKTLDYILQQKQDEMEFQESFDNLDQAQIREQRMANKMQAFDSIMEDHESKLEEFTKKYDTSSEL